MLIQISTPYCYSLSNEEKKDIGNLIWKNETGKRYDYLVFWNKNEEFPSLGIGHFIWYPEGKKVVLTETFPALLNYFIKKNVQFPSWLEKARHTGAPWQSKAEFDLCSHSENVKELRKLLSNTIELQVDFIIKRLHQAWRQIRKKVHPKKRSIFQQHYNHMLKSKQGCYALIDYLNFKGEGINPNERYNRKGWGLLQVLETMPIQISPKQTVAEFVKATHRILEQRVQNAPPEKKAIEKKWLLGWKNRTNTYLTI